MRVRPTTWVIGISLLNAGCSLFTDAAHVTTYRTRQAFSDAREWHRDRKMAHAAWECDLADLWNFLIVANGTVETVNNTTKRIVPLRFPDRPLYLIASKVDVRETGYDRVNNTYSKAIIDIDFATPQFGLTGAGAFMVQRLNYGGNMITIPGSCYAFGDGTKVNQDVGRFVPEVEYSVTYYQVPPGLDPTLITGLTGTVNSTPIFGLGAGNVLFNGGSSEVQTTALFQQSFQLELSFSFRPVPWNDLAKPDGSGFALVTDGGGNPIYTSADHTPLLAI